MIVFQLRNYSNLTAVGLLSEFERDDANLPNVSGRVLTYPERPKGWRSDLRYHLILMWEMETYMVLSYRYILNLSALVCSGVTGGL